MRTGVIAKKMGMTRLFQDDGRHVPVTVLRLEGCQDVSVRDKDRDGYVAVQLGAGTAKAKDVAKPERGAYGQAEVDLKERHVEFRATLRGTSRDRIRKYEADSAVRVQIKKKKK